ncbi:hypothetical protein lerEdw1_018635, partial [Lerista edwardsae]
DEDMQSLASLMSMKQADIGNLDDFEEDNEDDEENRVNQEEKAAKITELINKLNFLDEEGQDLVDSSSNPFVDPNRTELNPFEDPDMEGALLTPSGASRHSKGPWAFPNRAAAAASSDVTTTRSDLAMGVGLAKPVPLGATGSDGRPYRGCLSGVARRLSPPRARGGIGVPLESLRRHSYQWDTIGLLLFGLLSNITDDKLFANLQELIYRKKRELDIKVASSSKQEESYDDDDDDDEYNPFKVVEATDYTNPFDEPDAEPETLAPIKNFPPQPAKRKNVRPVDMSKYLYADTSKTDEDELDESNPFYEPKSSSALNNQVTALQETERKMKRKAPQPPVLSPKTEMETSENMSAIHSGKELSSSPK